MEKTLEKEILHSVHCGGLLNEDDCHIVHVVGCVNSSSFIDKLQNHNYSLFVSCYVVFLFYVQWLMKVYV